MNNKKRGFLEIAFQILNVLMTGPMRKTHVCYKVNLDSRLTNRYLSLLQSVGLVRKDYDDGLHYVITEKGIIFRNKFLELNELLVTEKSHSLFMNQNEPQLIEI